jgi:outer membrane lipoprotein-sorting protein
MKYKQNTILTFLILLTYLSFSQGPFSEMKDQAGFKHKFSEVTRRTQTIEANFIQEKNLSILSEKIITKGRFLFKKENKLRWEYTDPFHYMIILNNGTLITQDEEKKNKIDIRNNKMFTEINFIIMGCVQGNLFNDEKKFISSYFENNRYYLIKLRPVESTLKEYISEINISFDKNDLSVTRLEMNEPSGDYTIIEFTGENINAEIPDEKFFVP